MTRVLFIIQICVFMLSSPWVANDSASAQRLTGNLTEFQLWPYRADVPGSVLAVRRDTVERRSIRSPLTEVPTTWTPLELTTFDVVITIDELLLQITGEPLVPTTSDLRGDSALRVVLSLEGTAKQSLESNQLDEIIKQSRPIVGSWDTEHWRYYFVLERLTATRVSWTLAPEDAQRLDGVFREAAVRVGFTWDRPRASQELFGGQTVAARLEELRPASYAIVGPQGNTRTSIKSKVQATTYLQPFDPLKWSDRWELRPDLLVQKASTLGDVADRLRQALAQRGKFRGFWVYGYGEDGFAVVTLAEAITENGAPLGGLESDQRWRLDPRFFEDFSWSELQEYIAAGLGQLEQNLRFFAFVVSSKPISPSPEGPFKKLQQDTGRSGLPVELRSRKLDADAACQVLLYQWRRKNKGEFEFLTSGNPKTVRHLIQAGLWTAEELAQ